MQKNSTIAFFANSEWLDRFVLRPLSHIRYNWELVWDRSNGEYKNEADSYAYLLNQLIEEISQCSPPSRYHDSEDRLAEFVRDGSLNWPIRKEGSRWVGMDYQSILEQGGFGDVEEVELVKAASGRVKAAMNRGQLDFDSMEESHQKILAAVLSIILYHRSDSDPNCSA